MPQKGKVHKNKLKMFWYVPGMIGAAHISAGRGEDKILRGGAGRGSGENPRGGAGRGKKARKSTGLLQKW